MDYHIVMLVNLEAEFKILIDSTFFLNKNPLFSRATQWPDDPDLRNAQQRHHHFLVDAAQQTIGWCCAQYQITVLAAYRDVARVFVWIEMYVQFYNCSTLIQSNMLHIVKQPFNAMIEESWWCLWRASGNLWLMPFSTLLHWLIGRDSWLSTWNSHATCVLAGGKRNHDSFTVTGWWFTIIYDLAR